MTGGVPVTPLIVNSVAVSTNDHHWSGDPAVLM